MGRICVRVKAPFGEVIIEDETAEEILNTLQNLPPKFVTEVSSLISSNLTPSLQSQLDGVIEITTEGPIITTRVKLTHYEAIALVLFASKSNMSTASQVKELLASSGIKSMVPARLNEMTKRGITFKPDPIQPDYKLTTKGERWIKENILPKIKNKMQKQQT